MQKILVRDFFKYLFFFFCFFVLFHAGIYNLIFPFAAALALALVWCKQKTVATMLLYGFAGLIFDFSISQIIGVFAMVFVIFATTGIHKKLQKPISLNLFLVYGAISQTGFLISSILFEGQVFFAILSIICTLLFFVACKTFFSAILSETKLKSFENVCALLFLGAISLGLYNISVFSVPILQIFAPIVILLFSTAKNVANCVLVASALGLGTCLFDGSSALIAPFVVWAICASAVCGAPKILAAITLVATDVVLGFCIGFYETYTFATLASTTIGAMAFCLLPQSAIQKFANNFRPTDDLAMRSVVNRSRENICKRLQNLSDAFNEMDWIFRQMIKGGLTKEQVKAFLVTETKDKVCRDCPERNICHRKCMHETSSVLEGLVQNALERGKTTLLDAPAYLTTRCGRVSAIVGTINNLCEQWREYASAINSIDASRILIADELKGMSMILKNLSNEIKSNISFDQSKENQIITQLAFHGIVCADAAIYQQNLCAMSASLVVKKTDATNPKIAQVASKITGCKMAVADITSSPRAGWDILTLKEAPKYNLAFGTACIKKDGSNKSGDAYSIIKIANDKFLLAVCDGMGSGEKAEKASSLAIGLVENFYKAGFDNEIILSSVNKLLALNNDDIFSALDICVLDTLHGTCDFIKMGAPESFIKHQNTITKIFGGTLPLGIMQDACPAIIKQVMKNGDFVFLFTDGIADSFESTEALEDFINNMTAVNPQILAENLIEKATSLSGGARDDMTVIVAKIFKNF